MSDIGVQVKAILESTFDWIVGTGDDMNVTYVTSDGTEYTLKGIVADELAKYRREGVSIGEQDGGVIDRNTKRICFKTDDMSDLGIDRFDMAGHFVLGGIRHDFQEREPEQQDVTPMAGALGTFTVVTVRKAQELEQTQEAASTGDTFQWSGS